MGIAGLLPALSSITTTRHIRDYEGLKAGVDASAWLYKGLYCCCAEVVTDGADASDKYIEYCIRRLELRSDLGRREAALLLLRFEEREDRLLRDDCTQQLAQAVGAREVALAQEDEREGRRISSHSG